MSAAPTSSNRARDWMARVIRPDGSVRYIPPETLCWRPRYPQMRRARRDDAEVPLHCYDCPGCRELERRRLMEQFAETYRTIAAAADDNGCQRELAENDRAWRPGLKLFDVEVECKPDDRDSLLRWIQRMGGVAIERGFALVGVNALAVLSARPAELIAKLRRRGKRVHVSEIAEPTKPKSWKHFTRGLTVARSAYGEQVKRWYRRALARADKLKWEVETLAVYRPFNKATDARADFQSYGRVVPPRMWELQGAVSVDARKLIDKADSPEEVAEVMCQVFERLDRMGKRGSISVEPISPEQIERNRRAYQHVARMETDVIVNAKLSEFPPPPLLEEVTEVLANSSPAETTPAATIHSSGAPPPTLEPWMEEERRLWNASAQERKENSDRRAKKKLDDAIARLWEAVARRKNETRDQ